MCQRWLARPLRAANSAGVNSFCSIHPSVSSVRCHVTSTSTPAPTPASERNHPPPKHSSSHAPFRFFDGTLVKITWYRSFPACFEPNQTNPTQRYLEGERIKFEWFICPVQRLLAESRLDVVVGARGRGRRWDKPDEQGQVSAELLDPEWMRPCHGRCR